MYKYDACGNILKKEIYSKTSAAEVTGTPEKIINYIYADEWRDRMTGYDGQTVTYDAAGNPVTFLRKQMTWFRDQRLQSIEDSTTDVTYSYDEDGFRTKKIDHKAGTTTEYVLDGSLIRWEITKNNSGSTVETLAYTYDSYGRIIAFSYNGTQYYYVKNGQGDIVGIVDSSGETVVTYSYDSWGNPVNVEGNTSLAAANPFRYRGYYYDTESGLYYLNSRYYSPETGRFINADDTSMLVDSFEAAADGRNLYAYCNNNPVTYKDSTGEAIDSILDVISLATSVFSVISNPTDPTNWVSVGADIVCLIVPGLTGGGAAVKAAKNIDKGADVIENFKETYKAVDKVSDVKKMTGSYTIYYASGKVYDGKGGVNRAVTSAKRTRRLPDKSVDTVTGINWSSAPTHRDAFVDEYERMVSHKYDIPQEKQYLYNKIWSPGKKMTHTGLYNSKKHFVAFIRRLF